MAKRISPDEGKTRFEQGDALFVDIRDPASFAAGHLRGAVHLTQANVEPFLADTAAEKPLVIYCYHGNSSQGAADWLSEQGFNDVVSLDGGYEVLRQRFPDEMTIVLQNKFWDLNVTDVGFSVGLSFNQRSSHLVVPFSAITAFVDPAVDFGLQFQATVEGLEPTETDDPENDGAEQGDGPPVVESEDGSNVVTVDFGRKK